jgi:protocatechuate 3,4-dioxygenase, alpha subunit
VSADRIIPTPSQTVGPFFDFGLAPAAAGWTARTPGDEPFCLVIAVTDGDAAPVPDALVEIWQPDEASSAFARQPTRADGTCEFEMLYPAQPAPGQAPHINVCLFARGLLQQLHTRVYFAGHPALATDPVLSLVPASRRATLVAVADHDRGRRWRFPVRLQGPDETVFFAR